MSGIRGVGRRQFSDEFKRMIVSEVLSGQSVACVSRRHQIGSKSLRLWLSDARYSSGCEASTALSSASERVATSFLPVEMMSDAAAASGADKICVRLQGGASIEFPTAMDSHALLYIVRGLVS